MIDDRDAPKQTGSREPGVRSSVAAVSRRDDPLIGAWIEKRFTVLERIGEGGMGKVYKAVQAPMGRLCALKVLSPQCEDEHKPEFHKRFFLEAATVARLAHPNTVTIYDYGHTDELYYIAMEYLDGVDLRRILHNDGNVHPVRVRHLVMQVCKSLQEAHELGVIHRDLKPENIIVVDTPASREHVKVVDFGLAKAFRGPKLEEITGNGLAIGSPSYMSPEQILGEPISPATDVYALGTLMFEMLTGDVPFPGRSRYKTLMAHVHEAPPTLVSRLPDKPLHPGWQTVLDKCLAKSPADRFRGMEALIAALKELPGPPAPRPSAPPRTSRALPPPRRSLPPTPASNPPPIKLFVAVFVATLLVTGTLAALWFVWHR